MSGTATKPVVLMIDDEEDFLATTSKLLARRGFDVLTATGGRSALELLRSEQVDLVVLDLKMPEMDGEEVYRHIRRDDRAIPVVMLTGHGSVPQAFQMAREGVADYLAKPCDVDALAAVISRTLAIKPRATGGSGERRPAVLLVDDELALLDSMRKVLDRRGIEVETADSGPAALERLASRDVDVVVVDVKMPGMDGLELLREIRQRYPDREVLILTGNARAEDTLRSLRLGGAGDLLGAMEHLTKPPDIDRLTELIQLAAAKRRAIASR